VRVWPCRGVSTNSSVQPPGQCSVHVARGLVSVDGNPSQGHCPAEFRSVCRGSLLYNSRPTSSTDFPRSFNCFAGIQAQLQASSAFAGVTGGHLFSLQCGRLVVDGPMGVARRWRVGWRGGPLHTRFCKVNQPLAPRCHFAAEGLRGVQIARQVGTASRRPHLSESAWIHCLARAVYSATVSDRLCLGTQLILSATPLYRFNPEFPIWTSVSRIKCFSSPCRFSLRETKKSLNLCMSP
jgi:hypothetical protein